MVRLQGVYGEMVGDEVEGEVQMIRELGFYLVMGSDVWKNFFDSDIDD